MEKNTTLPPFTIPGHYGPCVWFPAAVALGGEFSPASQSWMIAATALVAVYSVVAAVRDDPRRTRSPNLQKTSTHIFG
jgi:hypothetical protein